MNPMKSTNNEFDPDRMERIIACSAILIGILVWWAVIAS